MSFPGQADWVRSIREAGVLVLFKVRHLAAEVNTEVLMVTMTMIVREYKRPTLVSFLSLPTPAGLTPLRPSVRNSIKLGQNKRTGKQTNKTSEIHHS